LWIRNARGERRLTTIYVSRFWFQEPLFHLTLLIAFIGILVMAIYLRTRTLRRRSEILKRAVEMKTAELKQNLETLEASQNQLKQETALRENMNSVLLHDIRSPLLFLTQSSYRLNNSLKSRYPNILEPANVLANTVKDLYILSSDYITWLKNRKTGNNPETETLKLFEVLEETLNFYRPIISSSNNNMHFNCAAEDKDKTFCTDGQLLRCVLRNLIDNSNKYTRNGEITVELKHSGQEGIITIHDNGKGLPARILTTFAKRNMENPNLWTLQAMDSEEIGMNMILQFAEIINGKITYERMPNGVSKFQLILNELTCQASTPPDSSKSMP
jgi:signal transduction histidine kinase